MKEALQLKDKKLLIGICAGVLFLIVEYVVGFVAQFKINRIAWEEAGGLGSGVPMPMPSFSIFKCYKAAFTGAGFGVFVIFVLLIAGVIVAYKLYKKIYGVEEDERGQVIDECRAQVPLEHQQQHAGHTVRRSGCPIKK